MKFYGNQICCGSYACLNAIQDSTIDPSLFEISTAAPFGVRHCENVFFDRLLTTIHDPNQGLDEALQLWGYRSSSVCTTSVEVILSALRSYGSEGRAAVLGPINMGRLGYQAIPALLERMDHYIVLEYCSDSEILCTDSEGMSNLCINLNQLAAWISVDDVPEACGQITLRTIERERNWVLADILTASLKKALANLCEAEECGQGSQAVYACLDYLVKYNCAQWRLPFLYDIQYLHQRKELFRLLLAEALKIDILSNAEATLLQQTLAHQETLLSEIYRMLRWKNILSQTSLFKLGQLERELTAQLTGCIDFAL